MIQDPPDFDGDPDIGWHGARQGSPAPSSPHEGAAR